MEKISIWTKAIVMSVIIVSILEMLLPNNKTKKYVKMVMGIFILYNIISPLIKDKESLSFEELNIEKLNTASLNEIEVNQESMDRRLEELYIKEIEKDITKKIEKKGYTVKKCKVKAIISEDEDNTGITSIVLKISKKLDSENKEKEDKSIDLENRMIDEIQKIKKVDTSISKKSNNNEELEKQDIQNIKKFLIEEYEVSENCLKIN